MSLRAAIYARISDDRAGAGLGVARQEADCRALADSEGWDVVEVYTDNDVSAYDRRRKRAGWLRMLADIDAGRVEAVISWHPDRLYRQMRDLLALVDLCDRDRVQIRTVGAGTVDLSTATGRAVAKTVAAWNEHESEHKGERVKAANLQAALAGRHGRGGWRAFGYTADRTALVDDEADELRAAYDGVLAGRSLTGIVADLNSRGVATTAGGRWSVAGLRQNLLSPRNVAVREHRGQVVGPAVWPALVDRDTWDRTRALLADPDRRTHHGGPGRVHLLTGFLCCGRCGARMLPTTSQGSPRYACRKPDGCAGILIHAGHADTLVTALALARLERDADLTPDDPGTALLEAQVDADRARLDLIVAAMADDPDGQPLELQAAAARVRRRMTETQGKIARVEVRARFADPLEVRSAWPGYDLAQRRLVIGELIDRVDVGPAQRRGRTPEPERLSVTWR